MAQSTIAVTFKRVANGEFECYADGVLTRYKIINGSIGLSGRNTPNIYGVTANMMDARWLGPLRTAKMFVTAKLQPKKEGRQ